MTCIVDTQLRIINSINIYLTPIIQSGGKIKLLILKSFLKSFLIGIELNNTYIFDTVKKRIFPTYMVI